MTPIPPKDRIKGDKTPQHLVARVSGDVLFQAYEGTIWALDKKTGRKLWTFDDGGGKWMPWFAVAEGKVFAVVCNEKPNGVRGSIAAPLGEIVALDAASGKVAWRNKDFAGANRWTYRLVYADGALAVATFVPQRRGVADYGHSYEFARVDAGTGKTLWRNDVTDRVGAHYQVYWVRDGQFSAAGGNAVTVDYATGKYIGKTSFSPFDGCAEPRATPEWMFYTMSFTDKAGKNNPVGIARSSCDVGVFPGYGLLYLAPSMCGCNNYVNGYLTVAGDKPAPPIEDSTRRTPGEASAAPSGKAGDRLPGDGWASYMGDSARSSYTSGAVPAQPKLLWEAKVADWPASGTIVEDWKRDERIGAPITAPTVADGKVFVAVPHENRVEARDLSSGKLAWSYTVGGRIDTPPTVYDGLCLFGSRDGKMHGLRSADGKVVWTFMAAISDKRGVEQSHLESVWPVSGSVAIHKGNVFFAAGRQSSIDGGIYIYKLDPYTGRMIWRKRFYTDPKTTKNITNYGGNRRFADLVVSDGQVLGHYAEVIDDAPPAEPDALIPIVQNNGRGKGAPDLNFLRTDSMGLVNRRIESIGRYFRGGVRYGALRADHFVVAGDMLYSINAEKAGAKTLAGWKLDKNGLPGAEPDWKATGQDASVDPEGRGGNFCAAVAGAGDRLVLARSKLTGEAPYLTIHDLKADGKTLARVDLPAPVVHDGMAVSGGKLMVSGEDGVLRCFGE